jgi:pyridoxine 5-phosphate synthase
MRIGFYINPIARLRESHPSGLPDPALSAALAESAGAQVILAGWASSGGLLTERDILMTRELVRGDLIIIAPLKDELVDTALKFHPDGVILVDATWDGVRSARPILVEAEAERIFSVAGAYKSAGVPAGIFIEPNAQAVKSAARQNVVSVTLDCSLYAASRSEKESGAALDRVSDAALASGKFGLMTAAGHGLTGANLTPIASVRYVEELYIGQWIAARGLIVGLDQAVREIISTMQTLRTAG